MRACCEACARAGRRFLATVPMDEQNEMAVLNAGQAALAFAGTDLDAPRVLSHLRDIRTNLEGQWSSYLEGLEDDLEDLGDLADFAAASIVHAFLFGWEIREAQGVRA